MDERIAGNEQLQAWLDSQDFGWDDLLSFINDFGKLPKDVKITLAAMVSTISRDYRANKMSFDEIAKRDAEYFGVDKETFMGLCEQKSMFDRVGPPKKNE